MAEKILVTGGGGFLGQAIIRELLKRGHKVHTLNRNSYPELSALGVTCFQGDLADLEAVRRAAETCTAVMHVGAKTGIWGSFAEYYQSNVVGTQNVIKICRELKIPRLVYTSSPSVTFGGEDQEGVNEQTPYPSKFLAHYPATKAIAEQIVLAADSQGLSTVALRPHLIWGPGDQHIIPRILKRAEQGRLRLIGSGQKRVDAVYIDNAVQAHLCALDRLAPGSQISGKTYYITNDEPWTSSAVINGFLKAAGLPKVTRRIPCRIAVGLGLLMERIYTTLRIPGEPPLTRFAALQLGTAHWYDTRAAREELGYFPSISMDEGMQRLAKSFRTIS